MATLRFFCQYETTANERCTEAAPRWYYDPLLEESQRCLCEAHAGEYVRMMLRVTERVTGRPRPRNSVALVMQDGLVLAVSRKDDLGDFGIPGGKLDPGETPEEALVRELLEETGIVAREFEWCFQRIDHTDNQIAWCYRVSKWSGQPRRTAERGLVEWMQPSELVKPRHRFSGYNQKLFDHLQIAA